MKRYCFGIDVGGTTIKCGLFQTDGKLLEKWEVKTRTENSGEKILPDIADTVEKKLQEKEISKEEVIGIGVGVPGPVNSQGDVIQAVNLFWGYKKVSEELEALTGIPAMAGNDANVAALGEAWKGAAAGEDNVVMVTLREFAAGNLGIAGALMIILLASEFFIPLRLLGSFFHIAMNGMAASDKIFALLDLPEPKEKTGVLVGGPLSIQAREVRFSYEEDRQILKGVSLEFPAGSFTSLVGTSGCGKSTIAGILMGRNQNYQGSIRINGQELSEISEKSLMEKITLVSHNSYLFKGTVKENLKMGKPDASDGEMNQVLEKVNLSGFLNAQEGLDTQLLEKGSNFSGGQCQRLALARALLHDSP